MKKTIRYVGFGALVLAGALLFVGSARAALEVVQTRPITFSGSVSPSTADTSVTISVDGLLSAHAKGANCQEDPNNPNILYTDWYDIIATQTVPANAAEITSGPFAGQTIPLTVVVGSTGSDCSFPGERTSISGSKNFSTTAIANGTYATNIRITDSRGIVANQSVNVVVSHPTVPAPTVTLSASPTSVTSGTKTTLTWSSTNADSCTATAGAGFSTAGATSGSDLSNNLTSQTVFIVSCTGSGGIAEKSAVVTIATSALVCSPSTQTVNTGQSASFTTSGGSGTIAWSAPGGSPSSGSNSAGFSTTYTTTGSKTVTVSRGGSTATCAVTVNTASNPRPPDLVMSAPASVLEYTSPTISWTVSGATSCVENPEHWYWSLPVDAHTDGSHSVVASAHTSAGTSRTYDMTCSNGSGSVSGSVTVATTALPPTNTAPAVDLQINSGDGPISIASGASATLSWSASGNPTPTCTGDWSGTKALSGSESTGTLTNPPTGSKTYILTCTNSEGSASDSVTVNVNPQSPTQKTLSVTKSGNGSGTVTSSPSGISCGADCSESYTDGTTVALTATPASGSVFSGWSGDADCADGNVTMIASKTCNAAFNTSPSTAVTCQASPSTISVGQQTTVQGFGGSGTRVWSAPDGTPDSQIGGAVFKVTYNSPGLKLITNTIGGSSGSCNVTVAPTTGTIQVNSWDVTSGSRVALSSTWAITGSKGTLTQATPSTSVTHSNVSPGTWTLTPTPPDGYSISSVQIASSQTVSAGNTTTYDIEYQGCTHCADFVSQSGVPSVMYPGEQKQVSITMRNTGTNIWTQAENYRLGSQSPGGNTTWGLGRVQIPSGVSIANGQTHTFTFTITAPASEGIYNFQWRMLQEAVKWFGGKSTLTPIAVDASGTPPPEEPGEGDELDVEISANPLTVVSGDTTTLIWNSEGALECHAEPSVGTWTGPKDIPTGTFVTHAITSETDFTILCTNATDSVSATVNVPLRPPEFSLSANPNTVTLSPDGGEATPTTVTVNPLFGFNATVTLSAQVVGNPGVDALLSYDFSPGTLSSGQYGTGSVLTIGADEDVPEGTYTVRISGTGGSENDTVDITLDVGEGGGVPPPTPIFIEF